MFIANTKTWYMERIIYLLAGIFTATGTALGYFVSPYWLILPALVAVNLLIFAITGFCIMANILNAVGIRSACKT